MLATEAAYGMYKTRREMPRPVNHAWYGTSSGPELEHQYRLGTPRSELQKTLTSSKRDAPALRESRPPMRRQRVGVGGVPPTSQRDTGTVQDHHSVDQPSRWAPASKPTVRARADGNLLVLSRHNLELRAHVDQDVGHLQPAQLGRERGSSSTSRTHPASSTNMEAIVE